LVKAPVAHVAILAVIGDLSAHAGNIIEFLGCWADDPAYEVVSIMSNAMYAQQLA
jgi:hypothetical protein